MPTDDNRIIVVGTKGLGRHPSSSKSSSSTTTTTSSSSSHCLQGKNWLVTEAVDQVAHGFSIVWNVRCPCGGHWHLICTRLNQLAGAVQQRPADGAGSYSAAATHVSIDVAGALRKRVPSAFPSHSKQVRSPSDLFALVRTSLEHIDWAGWLLLLRDVSCPAVVCNFTPRFVLVQFNCTHTSSVWQAGRARDHHLKRVAVAAR